MNRVVKILMERDGISESEAKEQVKNCRNEMYSAIAIGDFILAEEIIEMDLGLEPDYIPDIL